MRELHFNYGEEPYKVYRFRNRKGIAGLTQAENCYINMAANIIYNNVLREGVLFTAL